MEILTKIVLGFVALEHLYFMYFEMFAWETIGKRTFKQLPVEMFKPTKPLAANQGLYNGFLAAGLIWSLVIKDSAWANNVALFFLVCVSVAGIYGGITASRKIFVVQALAALVAIALLIVN